MHDVMVGHVAMILVEERALRLDEPVRPWLPELTPQSRSSVIKDPVMTDQRPAHVTDGLSQATG